MQPSSKIVVVTICIIGILYTIWKMVDDEEDDDTAKPNRVTFIPTHEWQEVKPDEVIPPVLFFLYSLSLGTSCSF